MGLGEIRVAGACHSLVDGPGRLLVLQGSSAGADSVRTRLSTPSDAPPGLSGVYPSPAPAVRTARLNVDFRCPVYACSARRFQVARVVALQSMQGPSFAAWAPSHRWAAASDTAIALSRRGSCGTTRGARTGLLICTGDRALRPKPGRSTLDRPAPLGSVDNWPLAIVIPTESGARLWTSIRRRRCDWGQAASSWAGHA